MSIDGKRTKWPRNIAKNFNRLSRVHERYRQTTDGRSMTCSERQREFTFAKKQPRYIYLFIYLKSMTEGPEGHLYCQKYTKYTEYTTQIKQRKKTNMEAKFL